MKTKKRIVATAPIDEVAIRILEKIAPVEVSPEQDENTLMGYCAGTIAFVSRGSGAVTARMIEASDDLKVVGRPGAGYDTVDIAAATARRIPVVYAPVGAFAVAEGALAMLLALVKRLPECDAVVKSGQWKKRFEMTSGDMTGHTLGIVGIGRIGSHLARLVEPFEMTVLAYDPYVSPGAAREIGVEPVDLETLLRKSDFVSLHIPLSDETRGIINRHRVSLMKRGAILVNTARGHLIESLDIVAEALQSGQLSGVGLDVFPNEPPDVSHRVFQDNRCLCAPHLVGVSTVAMDRIYRSMANDMVAILEGNRPRHCVNPEILT